jgi:AcrR family transcriptional regulator
MAPTPRLPREERRAQLMEAAAAAFRARGFDGTSMDDIAQTAGVTRLILYRNFGSKEELYREVIRRMLGEIANAFQGLTFEQVAERGAARVLVPVARANPDSFRLLWRDTSRQPLFADLATEFLTYVRVYARAILATYVDDQDILDWAARTAGAHLVEGICNWLDDGDPARDDELATRMSEGLRALATAWLRPAGS